MTTAPELQVDGDDPTPAYEQLRRQLADLIGSGRLVAGDRLPPLRQLAADLGLAVGTVGRAYKELEAEGLVRSRRGGGTRVHRDTVPLSSDDAHTALTTHADAFARQARLLGATDDEALDAARTALRDLLAGLPAGSSGRDDPGAGA